MASKTVSKITLNYLREIAGNCDYDWKNEVLPRLDEVIEYVDICSDKKVACRMGLHKVLGTPKKRKLQAAEKKGELS